MPKSGQTEPEFRIIRLPRSARYALQGMAYLARRPDGRFSLAEDSARARGLPGNFLSKIFQRLARRGLLVSQRGPGGGYALARSAGSIRLGEIVEAVDDPPTKERECLLELRRCGGQAPCAIHGAVVRANGILREALQGLSLADLTHNQRNPPRDERYRNGHFQKTS